MADSKGQTANGKGLERPVKVDNIARWRPGNKLLRIIERIERERKEAERA